MTTMATDPFVAAEAELIPCIYRKKVPQLLLLKAQSCGWIVRATAGRQLSPVLWLSRDGQELMVRFTHTGHVKAASTFGAHMDESINGGKLGKLIEWLL